MKNIVSILIFITLLINIGFTMAWCYCLERNLVSLQNQMNFYQESGFNRDEVQDKEIRLIQQDVLILENGGKQYE